ncbi:hypothetical protein HanRHA438_Chr02g0079991 [Helianthus annuus]|nr:hypothetical protein HanRHA438_Chr02g0079991 [Helianthus annuus]
MSGANPSQKKRKNKGKAPPGPDQAVIGWKEEEFHNLVQGMGFRPEWGAQYPTAGSTAVDAPPGYLTLYVAFFREGNFRLPITKFTASVLRNYGLHNSQINAIGLPRITHFEFVCKAHRLEPTFEMFNVFYSVTYANGFYSFNARTGVSPVCSVPLKSLHDWKQKFFYIRRGVIPTDMHYRSVSEGIPKVDVLAGYPAQDWYKKITHKATAIAQLEEMALIGAGMSLLWAPKNPLGVPVYGYQGKFGYSLINVLDPKAAGAMVEAIQEDGKPAWLDQIRGRFLHPSDESFARYANVALGEDDEDDPIDPFREEVVVLSSGSSDKSFEGLTSRCARAGTAQAVVNEPVHEVVGDDAEVSVDLSAQVETRRKTKADKPEKGEKRVEGKTAGTSQKALEDKKRKLDEQAAALLASKKAKLHKEAPHAPSESEIDMGIFSGGRGNLLEEIFAASAPTGVKSGKKPRKLDISQITPPASPPSRTIGLTPPRDDSEKKKKKEDKAVAENVGEGGGDVSGGAGGSAGGEGVGDRGKGVETEVETSEATPHQTIYTKRPQFENVHADSWDTHNPACDNLPHAPCWNLTQGSRMNDLGNCHDFFSMSLPTAERMFQKRRNRFALLDDHVRAGVNFFATSQEIVREWRLMGEETAEFEDAKRALAEEREKFNAEKKGLQWRLSDAEQKLEEQKQVNIQKQKDRETACERTNAEMQSQRDAIVRLSGEKKELADEAHQARTAFEKREKEYVARIDKLELLVKQKVSECEATGKLLEEKTSECAASDGLVEEVSADCRWLLSRAVPLLADRIVNSPELATYMFVLGQAGYNSGRKYGYSEGKAATINKEKDHHFELYAEDCDGRYAAKRKEFSSLEFVVVKAAEKLARKVDGVALLKKALGDEAGAAGTRHPKCRISACVPRMALNGLVIFGDL